MRFLADMGVPRRAVAWLREGGHDALHLSEAGLQRLPDAEVLAKASAEKRILLTFDLDFSEIVALTGGNPASVVVFRLRDTRPEIIIRRLDRVLAETRRQLEQGAIITVEDARIRVRSMPIG